MKKREVTLYMKNGKVYQVFTKDNDTWYTLLETIKNDQNINIVSDNKTITIRGSSVDYYESKII